MQKTLYGNAKSQADKNENAKAEQSENVNFKAAQSLIKEKSKAKQSELYVVRHGQTDWNIAGRCQGHTDIPLNDNGRRQALIPAETLRNVAFDAIFASPLLRARETCEIIMKANLHGGEIKFDKRLMEQCYGVYEGQYGLGVKEWDALWDLEKDVEVERGERVSDVFKRVDSFLKEIKTKFPSKKVLVVAHGGTSSVMHYIIKGEKIQLKNCEIMKYEL